jgi:hypothetical protein
MNVGNRCGLRQVTGLGCVVAILDDMVASRSEFIQRCRDFELFISVGVEVYAARRVIECQGIKIDGVWPVFMAAFIPR